MTYNYFSQLIRSPDELLELFAFGTLKDYHIHKERFNLTPENLQHLARLSVLSLCNDFEGLSIPIRNHVGTYGLENTDVDAIAISLVDEGAVDMSIDELNGKWIINKCHVIRDAYDARLYELKVLSKDNLTTVQDAKEYLKRWYEEKLT